MQEEYNNQNITLEDRKKLSISGVKSVENFDDSSITLITNLGTLNIRGNDIKIEMLNLDMGGITATGDFYLCEYISEVSQKKGFFSGFLR
ncbi:MAG: sporulation protein YabP [Ruminococcaceae bacterium]|nr:sporulation protein YabP [Oscillospiraceae bacterium]